MTRKDRIRAGEAAIKRHQKVHGSSGDDYSDMIDTLASVLTYARKHYHGSLRDLCNDARAEAEELEELGEES